MVRRLVTTAVSALLVCALLSPSAQAGAARPTVTEPPPGTTLLPGDTSFDLAAVGYRQQEFFISMGRPTATRMSAPPLEPDGALDGHLLAAGKYKTRIIVYRPSDPSRFNGTVVVEWLNVSGRLDAAPDWIRRTPSWSARGFAWVGVSAQIAGVDGVVCATVALPLPGGRRSGRYGSLLHPGDSFSYDIFSQAGQAVRDDPDDARRARREALIAVGESQSAFRLVTYIDAIHPIAARLRRLLRAQPRGVAAPLSEGPQPPDPVPVAPTLIRDDLDVPVLVFQTENDFASALPARQPDSDRSGSGRSRAPRTSTTTGS